MPPKKRSLLRRNPAKSVLCILVVFSVAVSLIAVLGRDSLLPLVRNPSWAPNAKTPLPPRDVEDELAEYDEITRFAPVFRQVTFEDTRRNFITSFDYDGDLNTNNNQNNLYDENQSLPATVYYAIVVTETHYFLTYFLYHARDGWEKSWGKVTYGWLGGCHENDGESLQLVVERGTSADEDRLAAVALQHHNTTSWFIVTDDPKSPDGTVSTDLTWAKQGRDYGAMPARNALVNGRLVVWVEPGKHGLALSKKDLFSRTASLFKSPLENAHVMTFSPKAQEAQKASGRPGDLWQEGRLEYEYQLVPIRTALWDRYLAGEALGRKGVMEGGFDVTLRPESQPIRLKRLPRFFNSNAWSVLFFKTNSGIMPFYLGKGRLFFDPAWTWRSFLSSPIDPWAVDYEYNPYFPVRREFH